MNFVLRRNAFNAIRRSSKKHDEVTQNEEKSCSNCKHYFCLVNQGVWGCMKNCTPMLAEDCKDYDGMPLGSITIASTNDYSVCPICKSKSIVWNKDINNAFIKCTDCGYYLRKGANPVQ